MCCSVRMLFISRFALFARYVQVCASFPACTADSLHAFSDAIQVSEYFLMAFSNDDVSSFVNAFAGAGSSIPPFPSLLMLLFSVLPSELALTSDISSLLSSSFTTLLTFCTTSGLPASRPRCCRSLSMTEWFAISVHTCRRLCSMKSLPVVVSECDWVVSVCQTVMCGRDPSAVIARKDPWHTVIHPAISTSCKVAL